MEESGENEEADINIVQRLLINCNLSDSAEMKHIQIRSDDTDVSVLLLCHYALSQIEAVVTLRSCVELLTQLTLVPHVKA